MKMKRKIVLFAVMSAMVLASCTKEPDALKVETTEIHLNQNGTAVISSNAINPVYESQNEYHAIVSDDGIVLAMYVGETNILLKADNGNATIKVVVDPKYNTYKEPVMDWGASKEQVISKCGTPDFEDGSSITYYEDIQRKVGTIYIFDNSGLRGAIVLMNISYKNEILNFLDERYLYVGISGTNRLYMNSLKTDTATIGVGAYKYSSEIYAVTYFPV